MTIKKLDLSCNFNGLSSVYDFPCNNANELLYHTLQKINECIDISNNSFDFLTWLKDIGLPEEISKIIQDMYISGSLADIINKNIFYDFNEKFDREITLINDNLKKKMNYGDNITINQIDKNSGKIDESYLSDSLLSQITGNTPINSNVADNSIVNVKLANDSVTPLKMKNVTRGKNLFEGIYTNDCSLSGQMSEFTFNINRPGSVCAIIKVSPNTQYTLFKNESNRFRVAGFSSYPLDGDTSKQSIFFSDSDLECSFTTLANIYYIVAYVKSVDGLNIPSQLQLEWGNKKTEYESIKYNIPLASNSVTVTSLLNVNNIGILTGEAPITIDFKEKLVNTYAIGNRIIVGDLSYVPSKEQTIQFLEGIEGHMIVFNTNTLEYELYPSTTINTLIKNNSNLIYIGYFRVSSQSVFINGVYKLVTSERRIIPKDDIRNINSYPLIVGVDPIIVDFNQQKIFIKKEGHQIILDNRMQGPTQDQVLELPTSTQGSVLMWNSKELIYEIYTPSTSILYNDASHHYVGSIRRDTKQTFINGLFKVVGGNNTTSNINTGEKNILTSKVKGNYITTSNYITEDTTSTGIEYLNNFYAQWDNLMEKDPEYITKTLLGNDDNNLPIYRYDFKINNVQYNPRDIKRLKIMYLGNIHGHERHCAYTDLRFFTDLVDNYKNNDVLTLFRNHVHFIVVPVQTPWAFINKSRVNANGVNINRNYPSEWSLSGEGTLDYSGSAPASETETQIIINLLNNNKDVIMAIDHHNYNSFSLSGHISWIGSREYKVHNLAFSLYDYMDTYTKIKLPWIITENQANKNKNLFTLSQSIGGGLACHMVQGIGINGLILETNPGWSFSGETPQYSGSKEELQELLVNLIGNLILTTVENNEYLH